MSSSPQGLGQLKSDIEFEDHMTAQV